MIAAARDIVVDLVCRALCWLFRNSWRYRLLPHSENGETPMLRQLLVWPIRKVDPAKHPHGPPFSIYLQHFVSPESRDFVHRHKWQHMRSFVLSGMFTEERASEDGSLGLHHTHRAVETYTMDHSVIHRVNFWSGRCWTLFCAWAPGDDWGWYERHNPEGTFARLHGIGGKLGRFIPWRDHVKRRVPSLETGKVRP